MKKKFAIFILLAVTTINVKAQSNLKSTVPFPIMAFHGVTPQFSTKAHYTTFKDAGIFINLALFDNADQVAKALDVAKQTGVKLIFLTPELTTEPEKTVRRFMNHPALYGYFVADEPSSTSLNDIIRISNRINSIDRKHICYLNLFPNYATSTQLGTGYENYVRSYARDVNIPYVSFDYFALATEVVQPGWYANLETISSEARKTNKPFWAFIQTTTFGVFKAPTLAGLRIQAYSNLAYGAQCLEYFTYWTVNDEYWKTNKFGNGIVDKDGNKTPVYDRVKQMNKEIQNVSAIFLGCKVISVFHTGESVPIGTQKLIKMPSHFKTLSTQGIGAVVSQISNGGKNYLVIVNRDYINKMKLNYQCDKAVKRVNKEGILTSVPLAYTSIDVDPGDAVIFSN